MRFAKLLSRVDNAAKAFSRFFGHIEKYSATEEDLKILNYEMDLVLLLFFD